MCGVHRGLTSVLEEMLHLSSRLVGTCQDFVTIFAAAALRWGSESHCLSWGEGLASQKDVGKDGKMKVTAKHGERRGRQWEMESRHSGCVKNVLPAKSIRKEPGFSLSWWDLMDYRQHDSTLDSLQLLHWGLWGHFEQQLSLCGGIWVSLLRPSAHRRCRILFPCARGTACLFQALTYSVLRATISHRLY